MKAKDISTLIVLGLITAAASVLLSNILFGNKKSLTTKVEVVDKVTSEFSYENKPYFSKDAINPTKDITVNQNNNQKPLGQ